jgi:hypothetical protein
MGHWGTSCVRHREPAGDQDDDSPIPQSAICRCGVTVLLTAGRLPLDWRVVDGEARCGDCLRGSTVIVDLAKIRQIFRNRPLQPIGVEDELTARATPYRGCRIGDEIVCGFAAIEIRGGASAASGRDEAVSFLLDANELDQLIIELSGIRAELIASQITVTPVRERTSPCAQ